MASTSINYLGILLVAMIAVVAIFNIATVVGSAIASAFLFVTKIVCGIAVPALAVFVTWSIYEIFIR